MQLAADNFASTGKYDRIPPFNETTRDFTTFNRREVELPSQQVGDQWDVSGVLHRDGSVIAHLSLQDLANPAQLYKALGFQVVVEIPLKQQGTVDSVYLDELPKDDEGRRTITRLRNAGLGIIAPMSAIEAATTPKLQASDYPLSSLLGVVKLKDVSQHPLTQSASVIRTIVELEGDESYEQLERIKDLKPLFLLYSSSPSVSFMHGGRRIVDFLKRCQLRTPVILHYSMIEGQPTAEDCSLEMAMNIGSLLVDGLAGGVMLTAPHLGLQQNTSMAFNILQGSRMRSTKTEYISCPSCGRTLFNLQEVTNQIRAKTGHLPGVAIAVMGCIVNGVGEMADADFGYVGGSPGEVDLYVGKKMVKKGIPNEHACDKLVELIKEHGRWIEPAAPSDGFSSPPI